MNQMPPLDLSPTVPVSSGGFQIKSKIRNIPKLSKNAEQDFVFVIPDPHPMDCTRWFAQVDRNCVAQDGIRRIGSLVDTERDIRKTVTTLHKCFARCVI